MKAFNNNTEAAKAFGINLKWALWKKKEYMSIYIYNQKEWWYFQSEARKRLYRSILKYKIKHSLSRKDKLNYIRKLFRTYSITKEELLSEYEMKIIVNQIPLDSLIEFNRGFAICPIHKEKTPSLKLYPGNKAYCFGCNTLVTPSVFFRYKFNLPEKEAIVKAYNKYILGGKNETNNYGY